MCYEGCCLFPTTGAIVVLSILAIGSLIANKASHGISNVVLSNAVCSLITLGVVIGLPLWKYELLPTSWFHRPATAKETTSLLNQQERGVATEVEEEAGAAKEGAEVSTDVAIAASAPTTASDAQYSASNNAPTQRKRRMYFLDNIKSFLTVIVVMHHCGCVFSSGGWYLRIAQYPTSVNSVLL